jgi:toxin FitB
LIVLDTNVVSELMKAPGERNDAVLSWLAQIDGRRVYLTSLTVSEVLFGLYILPEGKRRTRYIDQFRDIVIRVFEDRILDLDRRAAEHFAEIAALRYRSGLHVPYDDVRIASIAAVNGMSMATRNVKDFSDCGVAVINPWDYAS